MIEDARGPGGLSARQFAGRESRLSTASPRPDLPGRVTPQRNGSVTHQLFNARREELGLSRQARQCLPGISGARHEGWAALPRIHALAVAAEGSALLQRACP